MTSLLIQLAMKDLYGLQGDASSGTDISSPVPAKVKEWFGRGDMLVADSSTTHASVRLTTLLKDD